MTDRRKKNTKTNKGQVFHFFFFFYQSNLTSKTMASYQTARAFFLNNLFRIYFLYLAYTHFHELVDTWTKHAQAIETQGTQKIPTKCKNSFVYV